MTALGYQNIPARIDRLRAHLKSRRGRRDRQALELLARLCRFHKDRTSSTIASVDDLLKTYYDLENDNPLYTLPNPIYALITKADRNVPDNRAYVIPTEMPVSHIEDDDPPIKSRTSQAYRDNYDRIFGGEPELKTGENTEDVADAPLPKPEPTVVDRILGTTSEPLECGCNGAYVCDTHYEAMRPK